MAVLLGACGPRSYIEVLNKPVPDSRNGGNLLNPSKLSRPSQSALRRENLLRTAKRDPAAVIRAAEQRLRQQDSPDLRVAAAELAINTAQGMRQDQPQQALGYYLTAIELTLPTFEWSASAERVSLKLVHNLACAELGMTFHETFGASSPTVSLPGPLRTYRLRWNHDRSGLADPAFFNSLRPASYLKIKGFENRHRQEGYGGAMVGLHSSTPERVSQNPFLTPEGWAIPLTALARMPKTGEVSLELHDLTREDHLLVKGRRYPLEADFTAPIATLADTAAMEDKSIHTMFRPDESVHEGLFLVAPYQPDRIPLILVHGLMSHPLTWREVANTCYADPVLRSNYQLMAFLYPTGYPVVRNAAELRIKLREFQKRYDPRNTNPRMKNMVMVGHSMGGILTNVQIRSGGDAVWNRLFDKPIDEIDMTDPEREVLRELAYFKANPNITRAVFVCAPHRGSGFANRPIGRLGANLIKVPVDIIDFSSEKLVGSSTNLTRSFLASPTGSIDDLRVGSPVLEALLEQPMPHAPVFHTIVGDRGFGDGPKTRSDGVVPYWSSHLEGAASELVVPTSHSATNHPETVAEIRRILYQHLGREAPPAPAPATDQ